MKGGGHFDHRILITYVNFTINNTAFFYILDKFWKSSNVYAFHTFTNYQITKFEKGTKIKAHIEDIEKAKIHKKWKSKHEKNYFLLFLDENMVTLKWMTGEN